MAESFSMQVIITDVPETTEVNAKLEMVGGLPDNMDHLGEILDTFEQMWPGLRKDTEVEVAKLLKKGEKQ